MAGLLRIYGVLGVAVFLFSCGGSLTPEQREKVKKAIEEGQIKRIPPAQLTEAAISFGKNIAVQVNANDPFLNDSSFIDSLSRANGVLIYLLKPGLAGLSEEEISIAEAYQAQGDIAGVGENIQRLKDDSLLFTFPIGNERPDGSRPFSHALAIKMAVKQIVLAVKP